MIVPPTDRAGVELRIGQTVRAEMAWGEVTGEVVGLRAAVGTVPAWVSVMRPGEWNETMVQAERCEVTT